VHKRVYIYGGLDVGPIVINRRFGFSWAVVAGLTTTFASSNSNEVSLEGPLDPSTGEAYARQATGSRYLVRPQT
jgi:hypothetical protein